MKSDVAQSVRDGIFEEMNIMMDGLEMKKVEVFKYLGSLAMAVGAGVQQRVFEGSKVLGAVRSIFKGRTMIFE